MTREFKIIITIFLLFFFSNQLSAFAKSLNNEIDVNNRIREISQNVRCLVCQNQSIDESNSELAKDLKILIKEKLILGDSDEEIYGFLKNNKPIIVGSECIGKCKGVTGIKNMIVYSDTTSTNTSSESSSNIVDNLNKLNDLYKSGFLTKEEFEKAKKKLLN